MGAAVWSLVPRFGSLGAAWAYLLIPGLFSLPIFVGVTLRFRRQQLLHEGRP